MATSNGSVQRSNGQDRSEPSVFVSYSHKDEDWKKRLVKHFDALVRAGRIAVWHDRMIEAGDDWNDEMKKAMSEAAFAVCLICSDYLSSEFCLNQEISFFLHRREQDGLIIIPVLLRPCPWYAFDWLSALQMLPRDGKCVAEDFVGREDGVFETVARQIFDTAAKPDYQPPKAGVALSARPEKIDIHRLPPTGRELFGRRKELALLDEAWAGDDIHVVSLVAWGGVGKSTLVNKWLERLKADNYRGARRVFGWSFFSQGTGQRATSADQFVDEALRFFGEDDPTKLLSPWTRGERLAELVQQEKSLLVLDGLEPLQDPFQGIKDPALQRLVDELAVANPSLLVITTRERVIELEPEDLQAHVRKVDLEQISAEAGQALLQLRRVTGTEEELRQASEAFGNHALAINLLANWLRAIPDHPIAKANEIPDLDIPPDKGRHPRRVMAAFAERFGEDSAEVEVLRLLGLFDRPATKEAIDAVRAAPVIPSLTDHLSGLDEAGWLWLLESLRELGLAAPASHHAPDEVDAHPLVREHFGEELREKYSQACRAGHERLYEHFKALPEKRQPNTLEEMAPLFQAVFHGCQAGRHQEALDEVYWARIVREQEAYLVKRLGAFGADLAALDGFFDLPWEQPVASITKADQAFVLGQAGFRLRALGRLAEAVASIRASLNSYVSQELWMNAAGPATNLSELQLTLGEMAEAIALAEQSVDYADRRADAFGPITSRATLAAALHQAGERARAEALFQEAERLQAESQPYYPRLYSLRGYNYCDLLLDLGLHREVRDRAAQTLHWEGERLLDIALDHLSLGRAELLAHEADGSGDLAEAAEHLNQAVDGLREAGMIEFIPHGLLARAAYFRISEQYDRARRDLDEARRIATRPGMRLFKCDAHLEYARLVLAQNDPAAARTHLTRAAELVAATGYHRRDREVEELKAALG